MELIINHTRINGLAVIIRTSQFTVDDLKNPSAYKLEGFYLKIDVIEFLSVSVLAAQSRIRELCGCE